MGVQCQGSCVAFVTMNFSKILFILLQLSLLKNKVIMKLRLFDHYYLFFIQTEDYKYYLGHLF